MGESRIQRRRRLLLIVRVVAQESPTLFRILGGAELDTLQREFVGSDGITYYRAETHDHWVLYKAAISGWGAAAPNPADPRPVFSPEQR